MKVAVCGATGRMGRAVVRLCHEAPDIQIVGAVAHPKDPDVGQDVGVLAGVGNIGVAIGPDVNAALLGAEVAIDFSNAEVVAGLASAAARAGVALVTGTTNLDDQAVAALDSASKHVPVLWARNMSLGIQLLAELVEFALARLPNFDVEITEVHHRHKVDAPSGTALRLADAVRSVRENAKLLHGRQGQTGARTDDEVAVFGLRGGDVVGDHTVYLFGPGERLELTHRASNRDVFAQGALAAARFLATQKPGRYTISDVLSA